MRRCDPIDGISVVRHCLTTRSRAIADRTVKDSLTVEVGIKAILEQARSKARSAVNSAMVEAYWLIGQRIVHEEQRGSSRAVYGERLLVNLSRELSASLGKGFSYANLRNFRQFYLTYSDPEICYTACSRLSWSHNRLIMREEDLKRGEDDNPTIGIILCDGKDETVVKYSVIQENQQLFASKYQRILPTEEELIAEITREKRLIEVRCDDEPSSAGTDENRL